MVTSHIGLVARLPNVADVSIVITLSWCVTVFKNSIQHHYMYSELSPMRRKTKRELRVRHVFHNPRYR